MSFTSPEHFFSADSAVARAFLVDSEASSASEEAPLAAVASFLASEREDSSLVILLFRVSDCEDECGCKGFRVVLGVRWRPGGDH